MIIREAKEDDIDEIWLIFHTVMPTGEFGLTWECYVGVKFL